MRVFVLAIAVGTSLLAGGARSTENDPQTLLGLVRQAGGGAAWDHAQTLTASGDETAEGLRSAWHSLEDLRSGRFLYRSDFGVFGTQEVFDGTTRWHQERSGGVHPLDSAFARSAAITESWLAGRRWLRADVRGAKLESLGSREADGQRFDLIAATPAGGQPVELWFDAKTHLLGRTVRIMPISIVTVRYADYREISGLKLPFTIETIELPGSPQRIAVSSYRVGAAADANAFNRPQPPRDVSQAGQATTVALAIDRDVIVQAKINGQGPFEFILDTGGHDILTPEVAHALGLKPVGAGRAGGAGEGSLAEQDVRVNTLTIGDAVLRDQHFFVIPFPYATVERGTQPPLAGLLGLQLFERFTVELNYRAQSLKLLLPSVEVGCPGTWVPISFTDSIPLIEAKLDGIEGSFALDTGNGGSTVIQYIWAQHNGLAAAFKQGVEATSFGAGGVSHDWERHADSLELAGTTLKGPIVRTSDDKAGAFSSRTEAGNIGAEVLENFTLTFDYARERICFEPVPGFVAPPSNRSGMQILKMQADAFDVLLVRPATPAAEAGVEKGDKIVQLDGRAAAALSGDEVWHLLRQPPGTRVAVTFQRGEKTQQATLVLRELLP